MEHTGFRCLNCQRPVGRGESREGDLLICPTCARAINQDYGTIIYREDHAAFREQMSRPRPPEYPSWSSHWSSQPTGLTPLPPPTSTTRYRNRRLLNVTLLLAFVLLVSVASILFLSH